MTSYLLHASLQLHSCGLGHIVLHLFTLKSNEGISLATNFQGISLFFKRMHTAFNVD